MENLRPFTVKPIASVGQIMIDLLCFVALPIVISITFSAIGIVLIESVIDFFGRDDPDRPSD